MSKNNNPWAIFDDEALDLFPDCGFFREYINYAFNATDSPAIYHFGSAITAMGVALSNVDIRVETDRPGEYYFVPSQFWSVVVGQSTVSRKSEAMKITMRMLRRAMRIDDRKHFQIPSDGSVEAWTEHIMNAMGVGLLYRTEFASMLEQAGRSYSSGLKTWLLELWEGEEYVRKSLGRGEFIIDRPRISILGGVPPDTYKAKTHRGDWLSGFLARMVQWSGVRERRLRTPAFNDRKEMMLAQWVERNAVRSTGYIHIPKDLMILQDDWFVANIENKADTFHPEVLSCYNRYSPMIYRLAAYFAMAEQTRPISSTLENRMILDPNACLVVQKQHMVRAIKVAQVLKEHLVHLFSDMLMTKENDEVRTITQYLGTCEEKTATLKEISSNSGVSMDYQALRRLLGSMVEEGDLTRIKYVRLSKFSTLREKYKQKGQPPDLYKIN